MPKRVVVLLEMGDGTINAIGFVGAGLASVAIERRLGDDATTVTIIGRAVFDRTATSAEAAAFRQDAISSAPPRLA